jgi:small subunit ribosomal protein S11
MGKKRLAEKTKEEVSVKKAEPTIKKETKVRRVLSNEGRAYISSSYNNTKITLTNSKGDVLGWSSAGHLGFKGTKKATPFAASKIAESLADKAQKQGITKISVFVKGIGGGRDSAIKSLASHGLDIILIKDVTPIPHNGCRPVKPRRV